MSSINFVNVYLLFIAIPLAVLLTVPFIWAVRKDNRNGHNIASMVLHIALAVLIAFTAAGTQLITVVTETDVYVLADVSYSSSKNYDAIDGYISNISKNLPKNSKLGVVCFGKDYEILCDLGEDLQSVKTSAVDVSETNITEALEYTGTLFTEGVIKRIVVITDGKQSDTRDSNSMKRAVDNLAARNIHVDAIYLDDNISETANEVQISSVEASRTTYLNHAEKAIAVIDTSLNEQALQKQSLSGIATLYKDGQKVSDTALTLTRGSTSVSFDLDTAQDGTFEYEIRILVEEDESLFNNSYRFTQTVSGEVKVLLITGNKDDEAAVRELYGEKAVIDSYVNNPNVPFSVEALCKYDEIVLSNVDVSQLYNFTIFIESVDTVVSLFGKSLVTLGDMHIQNREDDVLKRLDDMLPVRYGSNSNDPKLYTFVIDGSRSMEFLYKLIKAKKAATQLVDVLSEDDYICVVSFCGDVEIVQKPVKLTDPEGIKELINNIDPKQGTFIGLGLDQAFELMKNLRFSEKQIMLFSDGLSYSDEPDNPLEIVKKMRSNQIYTSVIDVGRGADNSPEASIAKNLLTSLASAGSGNYYLLDDYDGNISELLFAQIVDDIKESVIQGYNYWAQLEKRNDEVLQGIDLPADIDKMWIISGFVKGGTKTSATTVLSTEYEKKSIGNMIECPLYAHWNYGNGKVATFTGGISGDWVARWDRETYTQFFQNVLETNIPDEKIDYPYTVETVSEGRYTRIEMTPASLHNDAVAAIDVTLPDGNKLESSFVFDSSKYYCEFLTPSTGKYTVKINYSYGGEDYTADASFNVSYLPEYDSFAVFEASSLYRMIGGNGTVSEDGNLIIENDETEVGLYTIDFTVGFLIACVVIFVIDIIVRKLKWNDIKSLFKKIGK